MTDHQLTELGAICLKKFKPNVTHIVADVPKKTLKYIMGMTKASHVVTEEWITACHQAGNLLVKEDRYFPDDANTQKLEKQLKFKFKKALKKAKDDNVVKNKKVYMDKDIPDPKRSSLIEMLKAHGAKVISRVPKKVDDNVLFFFEPNDRAKKAEIKKLKDDGRKVYDVGCVGSLLFSQNVANLKAL